MSPTTLNFTQRSDSASGELNTALGDMLVSLLGASPPYPNAGSVIDPQMLCKAVPRAFEGAGPTLRTFGALTPPSPMLNRTGFRGGQLV
jgi:hypothetical protein